MAYCNLDKVIYDGVGKFGIPKIKPYNGDLDITHWIGFNYSKKSEFCRKSVGVHFCLDDYQFETLWNHPNKYIENFRKCGAILSPDFSLYSDFPKAIQIYNHYRKHWLASFYQNKDIIVIPTIAWSTEDSYEWCFDGEPEKGIVAVSTTGILREKETQELFMNGYKEMKRRLKPSKIILLTVSDNYDKIKEIIGDVENIEFINVSTFTHKPIRSV